MLQITYIGTGHNVCADICRNRRKAVESSPLSCLQADIRCQEIPGPGENRRKRSRPHRPRIDSQKQVQHGAVGRHSDLPDRFPPDPGLPADFSDHGVHRFHNCPLQLPRTLLRMLHFIGDPAEHIQTEGLLGVNLRGIRQNFTGLHIHQRTDHSGGADIHRSTVIFCLMARHNIHDAALPDHRRVLPGCPTSPHQSVGIHPDRPGLLHQHILERGLLLHGLPLHRERHHTGKGSPLKFRDISSGENLSLLLPAHGLQFQIRHRLHHAGKPDPAVQLFPAQKLLLLPGHRRSFSGHHPDAALAAQTPAAAGIIQIDPVLQKLIHQRPGRVPCDAPVPGADPYLRHTFCCSLTAH